MSAQTSPRTPSSTVEIVPPENAARLFDDEQLSAITSFADAADALNSATTVEDFDDYGNGFKVLDTKDKQRLCGVPFVILEWRNNMGDNGDFVTMFIVTKNDEKWIVNDGSTGIAKQLRTVEAQRRRNGHKTPQAGLMVKDGLKRADYSIEINGKMTSATTYHLSN